MHAAWSARDAQLKKSAKDSDDESKCIHVKTEVDDKPEDLLDSKDKAEKSAASAKEYKCKVAKKKKDGKSEEVDAETWTSEMPDKYLKPKAWFILLFRDLLVCMKT